jgi:hypothetical protein
MPALRPSSSGSFHSRLPIPQKRDLLHLSLHLQRWSQALDTLARLSSIDHRHVLTSDHIASADLPDSFADTAGHPRDCVAYASGQA